MTVRIVSNLMTFPYRSFTVEFYGRRIGIIMHTPTGEKFMPNHHASFLGIETFVQDTLEDAGYLVRLMLESATNEEIEALKPKT